MKYGQRIKLRCALNPSADFVEVHEEVIPLHAVHDASKEIIEGEVYQEYECGFSGCPQAMRHMSPPCRTLDPRASDGQSLYQVSHYGGFAAGGKKQKEGSALVLPFKTFQDVRRVFIAEAAACGCRGRRPKGVRSFVLSQWGGACGVCSALVAAPPTMKGRMQVPKLAQLKSYRLLVTTCTTSGLLSTMGLEPGHFTHVLIDEAGEAMLAEAMVPLSLAADNAILMLAGDSKQLGPVVRSAVAKSRGLQ
ncbi:hypothetical protein CYMTET_30867, partial [Cymbomonas tetramitiformis]